MDFSRIDLTPATYVLCVGVALVVVVRVVEFVARRRTATRTRELLRSESAERAP